MTSDLVTRKTAPQRARGWHWRGLRLRQPIGLLATCFWASSSIALFFLCWWWLTAGEVESRRISPVVLPSLSETFGELRSLWFGNATAEAAESADKTFFQWLVSLVADSSLIENIWVTLRRVTIGFALAMLVGVPLGVLAGCFSWARAFLAPVVLFGRNIPLAALIPLTFFFFGIEERQKVMFIFVACVAFVIADVTVAISDISSRYLDTAYTLGANTWQAIIKVLVPLAMPTVFDSARLLFGLAFGYIMLAEMVRFGSEAGGLGNLILVAQRRGPREHIFLIVLIIPIVALLIDRFLYYLQSQLFPYRYGSYGWLHRGLRAVLHQWDDLKSRIRKPRPPYDEWTVSSVAKSSVRQEPQR
jgi:NitT/TauT family transport system permease protein